MIDRTEPARISGRVPLLHVRSNTYLPCSCGQKVRVETAQAGGQAACGCGKSLTVPTLRAPRQLAVAQPDEATAKGAVRRGWSPLQGALFSIGLIVTCVSLLVMAYNLRDLLGASTLTEDHTSKVNEMEAEAIDQFSLLESVEAYEILRDEGLGLVTPPIWVMARRVVEREKNDDALVGRHRAGWRCRGGHGAAHQARPELLPSEIRRVAANWRCGACYSAVQAPRRNH